MSGICISCGVATAKKSSVCEPCSGYEAATEANSKASMLASDVSGDPTAQIAEAKRLLNVIEDVSLKGDLPIGAIQSLRTVLHKLDSGEPTDTERLDWLEMYGHSLHAPLDDDPYWQIQDHADQGALTVRSTIDAARSHLRAPEGTIQPLPSTARPEGV